MRLHVIQRLIDDQQNRFVVWLPVALGTGIGVYFSLRLEPLFEHYVALICAALACVMLAAALRGRSRPACLLVATLLVGVVLAGARAHYVSAPVIGYRYYGPIEGRIVAIDRSASNRPRVTLDKVVLADTSPARTPETVRLSLHHLTVYTDLAPGLTIILTGHLSPPSGPVEPGGFDFQRLAWFKRLGAVGYSRTPVLALSGVETPTWALKVAALRHAVSLRIQGRLDGQTGAFAAAILTGDRAAIDPVHITNLRASNLAHLLAISGLHMGLLSGFVFAVIRYGLALSQPVALRYPTKKIAAACALVAAFAYLVLSGANVATERAFVMVCVVLVAVLLDRRALTLRAVAVAAFLVLVMRPESLIGAGFQMSFAATTALVATFAALREWPWFQPARQGVRRFLRPVSALFISSLVAGSATAPFAAYHFNQFAHFGLIANLASVPVMGSIVMPAAVVAGLLWPFGAEGPAIWLMGAGIDWILHVAEFVAGLDNAVRLIVQAPQVVLPVLAVGGLALTVLRGPARLVGFPALALAVVLWTGVDRPDLLVSSDGRLLGLMTGDGRALSKAKGHGFQAQSWLRSDGSTKTQAQSALMTAWTKADRVLSVQLGQVTVLQTTARESSDVTPRCTAETILILPAFDDRPAGPCQAFIKSDFRHIGSMAIDYPASGLRITGAYAATGVRLWTPRSARSLEITGQ